MIISAGSLLLKPTSAQSVSIPSVPEFTLKYIHSLWSNGTLQYDNNTIVVTIKNQHYSSSINGTSFHLFYDIRIKAHSAQDWQWTDLHPVGTYYEKEFTDYQQKPLPSIREGTPVQSSSQYTIVPLTYYNPPLTGEGISFPINSNSTNDIQVTRLYPKQAILLGYHPALKRRAIITYTASHGLKVWYWHDNPEEVTDEAFLNQTRQYLIDIAKERGFTIENYDKIHPAKLAHMVFSKLIPELKT